MKLQIPFLKLSGAKNINEKMLYFIAFLYAIATGEVAPPDLLRTTSTAGYGYYSNIMNEVYTLGIGWKYGLASSAEIVSSRIRRSDELTSQLLMKLAQVLRLGESLTMFMKHELDVMIQFYSAEYERKLESIKLLLGMYTSIMSTSTFMIAASTILTMLSGQKNSDMIIVSFISIISGLAGFVYMMHRVFPRDNLLNESGDITKTYRLLFYICIGAGIALGLLLAITGILPTLLAVAVSGIPLLAIGFYANKLESRIESMNYWYPAFVRYFGEIYSTVGSMGHAMRATLKSDFGPISKYLVAMLNRVENRIPIEDVFNLFSAETGSMLITSGNIIISKSINKGANMNTVGSMVADISMKLNEMRKKRNQTAKVFESMLVILHILSLAVLSFMSNLTTLFSTIFGSNASLQNIVPITAIDPELLHAILPFIVLAMSAINGMAIKISKGGLYKTAWFNIGLLIVSGAITVYAADTLLSEMLHNLINLNLEGII